MYGSVETTSRSGSFHYSYKRNTGVVGELAQDRQQVVAALEGVTEWKPKTIHTLLLRLVGKGALAFEKEGRELRLVFLHELMHLQRRDQLFS